MRWLNAPLSKFGKKKVRVLGGTNSVTSQTHLRSEEQNGANGMQHGNEVQNQHQPLQSGGEQKLDVQ